MPNKLSGCVANLFDGRCPTRLVGGVSEVTFSSPITEVRISEKPNGCTDGCSYVTFVFTLEGGGTSRIVERYVAKGLTAKVGGLSDDPNTALITFS